MEVRNLVERGAIRGILPHCLSKLGPSWYQDGGRLGAATLGHRDVPSPAGTSVKKVVDQDKPSHGSLRVRVTKYEGNGRSASPRAAAEQVSSQRRSRAASLHYRAPWLVEDGDLVFEWSADNAPVQDLCGLAL